MRRFPWDIILALIAGIGLGLVYAWMISPMRVIDAGPGTLRSDFKDHYRSAIAAAYASTNNLPRAQARLALLKESDPIDGLNAQAQRMLAQGDPDQSADLLAALALAMEEKNLQADAPAAEPVTEVAVEMGNSVTAPPELGPVATLVVAESPLALAGSATPSASETLPAPAEAPSRPTQTPVPTVVVPFKLTGQDEVCDPNLPDGLLQVIVVTSNRRQIPGMEVNIAWEGGAEQFFTGLKPELGNGYADFIMTPNVPYTVQLAVGSDIAAGLTPPNCQTVGGESFYGGVKLTFQRP